ncbi:MAG: D-alanyl-D-alanine carboxypeptidase [Alphaproteobacteria bacterium]|nr:D-alanyl-D-alanine carboxypeptidase [Alphaproteobacteria bacterium]
MSKQHHVCAPRVRAWLAAVVAGVLLAPACAEAAHARYAASFAEPTPGPVNEFILLDAETGQVLGESNADAITYPASLTKMMTLYLTFEALNAGRLRLDQTLWVSAEAASRRPSKLGLTPGDWVAVHDLILGLVTKSANDAASVLAEGLAGSEAAFAARMTAKARQLGMANTTYHNASGLPDPEQRTTARDIARLALALYRDFPREYRYFSTREFEFRGATITSHNHLLEFYDGADGIKTGFINASGFNLAASAVRNGHRLIGVIMGGRSAHSRDEEMADLLDRGFAAVAGTTLVARREPPPAPAPVALPAAAPTVIAAAAVAPVAATAAVVPAVAATAAAAAQPEPAAKPGLLGKARLALQHLSPVSKAEASPLHETAREAVHEAVHETVREPPPEPATERWAVQLGAFRVQHAADKAARAAAALPIARGKPLQVLQPAKSDKAPLYRARLLNFALKEAEQACAALEKKKIECTVVRAPIVKVASR